VPHERHRLVGRYRGELEEAAQEMRKGRAGGGDGGVASAEREIAQSRSAGGADIRKGADGAASCRTRQPRLLWWRERFHGGRGPTQIGAFRECTADFSKIGERSERSG
jgi:hypothetical protein